MPAIARYFNENPLPKPEGFAVSHYKEIYAAVPKPEQQYEIFGSLHAFVRLAVPCEHVEHFFEKLQKEAMSELLKKGGELTEVQKLATYLWSSAIQAQGRELCSYLNRAIIEDDRPCLEAAMPLIRGINELCVTRGSVAARWPAENRTFRGAGLPEEHAGFFTTGRRYRVKMLLATSFKRGVAVDFARRNSGAGKPPVIYTCHYHPELRCVHVNFIPSVVPGEDEFLFAAYPLFLLHLKVQSERSSAKGTERVSAFCGFGLQCHM